MECYINIENSELVYNGKKIFFVLNEENNILFKGKDVAEILGYHDTKNAIKLHVDEYSRMTLTQWGVYQTFLSNIHPQTIFINESGLYSLILNSKTLEAKRFKRWIISDILLSIRRNGQYKLNQNYDQILQNLKKELQQACQTVQNKNSTIQTQTENINNFNQTVETSEYEIEMLKVNMNNVNQAMKTKEDEIKLLKDNICNLNEILEAKEDEIQMLKDNIKEMKLDIVPRTQDPYKLHVFILIKKNLLCMYPYFVIRSQRRNVSARIKQLRRCFPDMQIILKLNYNPNAINLYNRLKEDLKIECQNNHFKTNLSENVLKSYIVMFHNDKTIQV